LIVSGRSPKPARIFLKTLIGNIIMRILKMKMILTALHNELYFLAAEIYIDKIRKKLMIN
jgi:hypothetical protein